MTVNGIKLPINHNDKQLEAEIIKKSGYQNPKYKIIKKSVDARYNNVNFVYNVEVCKQNEQFAQDTRLEIPKKELKNRPIVVGSGPCGLFAAYILAKAGTCPILLERGKCVEKRVKDINDFWEKRIFNPSSNVQFGEGGAGTFSDGKLTTQISNPLCKEVLYTFVECGANDDILYLSKPHLGTDYLVKIVKNLRNKIIELGGEVLFEHQLSKIIIEDGCVKKIIANKEFVADNVILALGHSARDTFNLLYEIGVEMEPKAFSVGARIEHLQSDINKCQYGNFANSEHLGAADYKLSYHTKDGRGVYTFCMCPGGVVVASASENNSIVTNGMSYYARDGINANSAFLVSVTPDDFGHGPLDGVEFQKKIEQKAYIMAQSSYCAPCQLLSDFVNNKKSTRFNSINPTYKPGVIFANLNELFPEFITKAMKEAIPEFSKKLKCFDDSDAVLTGPETRSSSPVRILRDVNYESNIKGLYPAGEGAGYAGGIMSAAVDGIKCALALLNNRR